MWAPITAAACRAEEGLDGDGDARDAAVPDRCAEAVPPAIAGSVIVHTASRGEAGVTAPPGPLLAAAAAVRRAVDVPTAAAVARMLRGVCLRNTREMPSLGDDALTSVDEVAMRPRAAPRARTSGDATACGLSAAAIGTRRGPWTAAGWVGLPCSRDEGCPAAGDSAAEGESVGCGLRSDVGEATSSVRSTALARRGGE